MSKCNFAAVCRYPEDPATGIAAAALASSLRRRGLLNASTMREGVTIFQGRAMGRCSAIRVSFPSADESVAGEQDDLEIWGEVSVSDAVQA